MLIRVSAMLLVNAAWTFPADGQTTSYAYDALGRLTTVNESGGAAPVNSAYAFDAAGNRTQVTVTPLSARVATRVQAARPSSKKPEPRAK